MNSSEEVNGSVCGCVYMCVCGEGESIIAGHKAVIIFSAHIHCAQVDSNAAGCTGGDVYF